MLHFRLIRHIAPLAFAALLALSACKDSPTSPATSPSVEGSWQILTANGQDVSALDAYWTFTKSGATYEEGILTCVTTFTYTTSGNKLIGTVVSDACLNSTPGTKDTITYTVNGDNMTMTDHGETFTLKKLTATSASLLGKWEVESVDGETSTTGNRLFFDLTNTTARQIVTNGGTKCETFYHMTRSGNALHFTVASDDCGSASVGDQDAGTYSINGGKLTIVFSDGTTIVCKKA